MDRKTLDKALDLAKSVLLDTHDPDTALTAASDMLGGYGVESLSVGGKCLLYANIGDTYDTTVCYSEDDGLFLCSWGDWYQKAEAEHCEDEDVTRCGYCGEFTPISPEGWRETICDHCGRNVSHS